tara:strand:- start:200 stop:1180 length:981 start_codon:yes stop_codon:yes gene_type:complete
MKHFSETVVVKEISDKVVNRVTQKRNQAMRNAIIQKNKQAKDNAVDRIERNMKLRMNRAYRQMNKKTDAAMARLKEDGSKDVSSMKMKVKTAMSALSKMNTELSKLSDDGDLPTWWTNKVAVAVDKLDGMADYLDAKVESVDEASAAEVLKKRYASNSPEDNPQATKRVKDGIPGVATYKMHKHAGLTNRGYSKKGKMAALKKQHARRPEQYGITREDSCCEECKYEDVIEDAMIIENGEKKGVKLNNIIRTSENPNKKFKVYVRDPATKKIKVVRFGDPNMEIKRDDPNRRKNFRARHNCDNPGPKTKARYWSCKQWRGGAKVEN